MARRCRIQLIDVDSSYARGVDGSNVEQQMTFVTRLTQKDYAPLAKIQDWANLRMKLWTSLVPHSPHTPCLVPEEPTT